MSRKKALENYTDVKDRLKLFKAEFPDYRVDTDIVATADNLNVVIIKAWLYRNAEEQEKNLALSSGIAEETRGSGYVNETSHVENCETSAIGRALANAGYQGSNERPSREEMEKVERIKQYNSEKKVPKKPDPEVYKEELPIKLQVENNTDDLQETSIETLIDSFTSTDELVEWFNGQLNKLNGKDKEDFRTTYLDMVRAKVESLYQS